jgi:hypothetical protein
VGDEDARPHGARPVGDDAAQQFQRARRIGGVEFHDHAERRVDLGQQTRRRHVAVVELRGGAALPLARERRVEHGPAVARGELRERGVLALGDGPVLHHEREVAELLVRARVVGVRGDERLEHAARVLLPALVAEDARLEDLAPGDLRVDADGLVEPHPRVGDLGVDAGLVEIAGHVLFRDHQQVPRELEPQSRGLPEPLLARREHADRVLVVVLRAQRLRLRDRVLLGRRRRHGRRLRRRDRALDARGDGGHGGIGGVPERLEFVRRHRVAQTRARPDGARLEPGRGLGALPVRCASA